MKVLVGVIGLAILVAGITYAVRGYISANEDLVVRAEGNLACGSVESPRFRETGFLVDDNSVIKDPNNYFVKCQEKLDARRSEVKSRTDPGIAVAVGGLVLALGCLFIP